MPNNQTPNGRGLGVIWRHPDSIQASKERVWHGGTTALFDSRGEVLPALKALGGAE